MVLGQNLGKLSKLVSYSDQSVFVEICMLQHLWCENVITQTHFFMTAMGIIALAISCSRIFFALTNCLIGLLSFVSGQKRPIESVNDQPQSCLLLCYVLLLLITIVKISPYKRKQSAGSRPIDEHGDVSGYYATILLHHDQGTLSKYIKCF